MNKIKKIYKNIYVIIFFFLIIFVLMFLIYFNKKAIPILTNYANVQTKKIGIEVLRNTGAVEINKIMKGKEFYTIVKNNKGEIESIDFDTTILNEALALISKNVRKRLEEIEKGENLPSSIEGNIKNKVLKNGIIYEMPLGIIFGNSYFYNLGPKIPVRIEYSGNIGLDVKTKVKDYGINSALIEIYIYVEVTQRTILPFSSDEVKLTSEVPVSIKIVKGSYQGYLNNSSYSLPIN